jgi:hypothetical protein
MALYDGRLKTIRDNDLFFWNGASMASTTSTVSDSIDLGAAQVFAQIPCVVQWYLSGDISVASSSSAGTDVFATGGERPGIWVQHCADNSQWSQLAFVEAPYAASVVDSVGFNAKSIGLVSVRRFVRLRWACTFGALAASSITMSAWLRMGLTE